MRQWIIILIFLLFACEKSKKDDEAHGQSPKSEIQRLTSDSVSIHLPTDIFLERLISFDSSRFLTLEIVLPKTDIKELQYAQSLLTSLIDKEKNKFIESIDPDPGMRKAASGTILLSIPWSFTKTTT